MIIGVTEQYHDYEVKLYFLDTSKLSETNQLEKNILSAVNKNKDKNTIHLVYMARENNDEEPGINSEAIVKSGPAEKIMYLHVNFDC